MNRTHAFVAGVALLGLCLFAGGLFAQAGTPPLVIADFEDGTIKPFSKGTVVEEGAAHGKKALRVEAKEWAGADTASGLPVDWSKYDVAILEVFNPTDKFVRLTIQVRDPEGNRGYWAWHNRYVALAPGKNTVQFAIADMWRGEILRRDIPGMLDTAHVATLTLNADGPWILDWFRLEALPVAKVVVPGLKAFKVGPAGAPGFPGFTMLTQKDLYSKEKGFGWTKTGFGRMDDRIHPDNLFRSWIGCANAELAVDLPNGKYRVQMQLEDPGYWELMQFYNRRTVTAEGKPVIDETMNAAEFTKRYFRNENAEDSPGEDPFEKYVETRHPWHTFDVEVADGQLNLGLRSDDAYGATLSALIVYPADQAAKGAEFLDYVKAMRKFDWSQRWKPVAQQAKAPEFAGKMADDAKRDGFALFAAPAQIAFTYDQTPADAQALTGLSVTAARGEYEPCVFGLKPAKPLGKVDVTVSALAGDGGATLSASSVDLRVGRYRFRRHAGDQSGMYTIAERELRPFNRTPADELRCDNFFARRFWVIVHVPDDAKPGTYAGKVVVKAEKGGTREIPIKVTVLPFKLPEPEHLFSLYGTGVLPVPYFPEMKAEYPAHLETMLRDLRDHGINYMKELSVRVNWANGKAVVTNADEVDREIALLKKLSFKLGPVNAPAGCELKDLAADGQVRGLPRKAFIEAWHKTLTDFFKERGWPHPVFCYGDEPNLAETLNALTAANVACHAVSPDIWMEIAYHVQGPEGYELMKTLDVHHLKAFLPAKDFVEARPHAKLLLNCNVGPARMPYGLCEWRATKEKKTDGCITFAYTGSHVDIYYGLDGREDDYSLAPVRSDGTRSTTAQWEQIRQGINDYRYALALDALANDPAKGAAAKALLDKAFELGDTKRADADSEATLKAADAWRADAQKLLAK